jgi:hypothetical protein
MKLPLQDKHLIITADINNEIDAPVMHTSSDLNTPDLLREMKGHDR